MEIQHSRHIVVGKMTAGEASGRQIDMVSFFTTESPIGDLFYSSSKITTAIDDLVLPGVISCIYSLKLHFATFFFLIILL